VLVPLALGTFDELARVRTARLKSRMRELAAEKAKTAGTGVGVGAGVGMRTARAAEPASPGPPPPHSPPPSFPRRPVSSGTSFAPGRVSRCAHRTGAPRDFWVDGGHFR
jgi:hypothetical protein